MQTDRNQLSSLKYVGKHGKNILKWIKCSKSAFASYMGVRVAFIRWDMAEL